MTKEIQLQILYSPNSGIGQAQNQANQAFINLSKDYPLKKEVVLQSVFDPLPETTNQSLTLLHAGDGSYFSLLAESLNHPNQFIIPMGGGGENVAARQFGTYGIPASPILDRILKPPSRLEDSFEKKSPWQAKNLLTGETYNFFWFFSVGGTISAQLLKRLEDLREIYPDSYNQRRAQALLGFISNSPRQHSQVIHGNDFSPNGAESIVTTGYIHNLANFYIGDKPQILHLPDPSKERQHSAPTAALLAIATLALGLPGMERSPINLHKPLTLKHLSGHLGIDSEVIPNIGSADFSILPPKSENFAWFPKTIID